jgi:hypothetical protein
LTLSHVLWIGGAPRSGKTSIATRIARRHGLRLYSSDTRTWAHRDRALREGDESAQRWEKLAPEARWARTPPELLELSLHAERGPMILDDLLALPTSPLVVAEGTPVSPTVVTAGIADRTRAVWLVPTAAFQRARLDEDRLPVGPRALYLLLAEVIEREARDKGVPILAIDESRGLDEITAEVEALFADALAAGPRAETRPERRALLREANEAIVAQIHAYYARPWAQGDANEAVRAFVCECGDTACNASVELPVGAIVAGPALAPGHR